MGGLRVLGHHEGCVLTKSPCYFWKSWSWRDINRHWMQQTGETTSIPKVDPSKTMGFNHLQLMAETALSTRFFTGKTGRASRIERWRPLTPKSSHPLAIFVPWYDMAGELDFLLIRKCRELLMQKDSTLLIWSIWKRRPISCLIGMTGIPEYQFFDPRLPSWFVFLIVPACRVPPFGESLVGGIDVKIGIPPTEVECQYNLSY